MENISVLCDDITDFCVDCTKAAVLTSLNMFSVLFSTLNLVFLKKLDKSRTTFFWIVVNID